MPEDDTQIYCRVILTWVPVSEHTSGYYVTTQQPAIISSSTYYSTTHSQYAAVTSTHTTAQIKILSGGFFHTLPPEKRLFLLFCSVLCKQRQYLCNCCTFSNHHSGVTFLQHSISVRGNNRIPVATDRNNRDTIVCPQMDL